MIRKRTIDRSANRPRSNLWQKCTNLRSLKQIHASMVVNGFLSNISTVRDLIFSASVAIPGALKYALQLFDQIPEPDIFMWNTVIRGCSQSLKSDNAVHSVSLYTQMEERGVIPDRYTFTFILKACTRLQWSTTGFGIHGKVVRYGFISNAYVRNTLINFHAKCGELDIANGLFDDSAKAHIAAWSALTAGYAERGKLVEARRLFDEMPIKDLVSWNVMITCYEKCGEMDKARELFDNVPKKDVVTWNVMISGYVRCGSPKEALNMFKEMRDVGEHPDEVTLLNLLSACADLGDLENGKNLHSSILEMASVSGFGDARTPIWNALIDMYAKCGSIERAMEVFRGMKDRDLSTWNSLVVGLALHGHAVETIDMFNEMQSSKIRPNEVTFIGVLVACSHAGRVDEGHRYFSLMRDVYNIQPNIKHYGCMVDMLGRAGLLNEAFEFAESMDIEPNATIWRTLLGACRIHGNVELGKQANENLLRMRSDESGDYVLLSNIYACSGEWDRMEKVRKMFDDTGVKKLAACSLIEGDNDKAMLKSLLSSEPKPRHQIS
ncbi:PREDICTED: pentatricopeptide repeat-containing protein At5g15300 [Tarenaya hassleriana]|uniref:pentatricopeptide repeat-containing protein At5g15300 n=1 Tax=Tarenaya hassleriana TaxID=28532 RepID=UPI00053C600A|nr:PREDICTED: pentatricopeptide repeat-containing protein At5g15300 [Tarenaya hassleriana]XP_010550037.1 PREDICTED: pentatricopeptide repeat-containing protein At5g15300 [Tarenaya hassleriana]